MNCILCGLEAGAGSLGGRNICAPCDCGVPPEVTRLRKQLAESEEEVTKLRAALNTPLTSGNWQPEWGIIPVEDEPA